jgi:hypothetical protein
MSSCPARCGAVSAVASRSPQVGAGVVVVVVVDEEELGEAGGEPVLEGRDVAAVLVGAVSGGPESQAAVAAIDTAARPARARRAWRAG